MMTIQDWHSLHPLRIGIATDHGGWEIKQWFKPWLEERGLSVTDYGPFVNDPLDDYPDFANEAMRGMTAGEVDVALLVCRSGVGMGIAANRYSGVRAVVAYSPEIARASRNHNCSNVLVLPADYADAEQLKNIAAAWLDTPFSGDKRHLRRLEKIESGSFLPISRFRSEDAELADILFKGIRHRDDTLDLVASESRASAGVRSAMSSFLNDKYAAGYPGARCYPDCADADELENLCIRRACDLFGAEAANVQPYSGSIANLAAYLSTVLAGETVMAMHPARGGHATHVGPDHLSGKQWKALFYEVNADGLLDYDAIEKIAIGSRPKLIVAGASSFVRKIDFERFRAIADKVHARLLVDMAHVAGLVAAGIYPNPVPYADIVTTTTHKTLCGPRGGMILCRKEMIESVNHAVFPLLQGGPLMHVVAAKALALREASGSEFADYQKQVVANAQTLCRLFASNGIVPVTGGTDTHMAVLDLSAFHLDGVTASKALENAGINVNPVRLHTDALNAPNVSGIRLGTLVVTRLGMKEEQMKQVCNWICAVLRRPDDPLSAAKVKAEIAETLRSLRLG